MRAVLRDWRKGEEGRGVGALNGACHGGRPRLASPGCGTEGEAVGGRRWVTQYRGCGCGREGNGV